MVHNRYTPDILGSDFEQLIIPMPDDYEGKVITTLIRRLPDAESRKAILYVHGYCDYYFHREMAEQFNKEQYNFYAIDLRKYGRSRLPNQEWFQVRNLHEYFADIDAALEIIRNEENQEIVLVGHSTGGLISALYCDYHKQNLPVQGLILNSPFLNMNMNWAMQKIVIPLASIYGKWCSTTKINQPKSTAYGESLLKSHHGEWEYDTRMKPLQMPPVSTGWIRAIHLGQKQVWKGLDIPCPILLLHSNRSVYGKKWNREFEQGDGVLNIKDIQKFGLRLGENVTDIAITNGLHDLVLSNQAARKETYQSIFTWLVTNNL